MRHLGSLVLSLLLAAATWVLTGIGISKFVEARADPSGLTIGLALGLAAILAAGLCYTLLILPRLSPLGPFLVGLALLGLVAWRVSDLSSFNQYVPEDILGAGLALRDPADGYAALLALPLVSTVFSARRWRRHEFPPAEYAAPMSPAYPDPNYSTSTFPGSAYPPSAYPAGGAGDDTWPFSAVDTETTRRL